MSNRHKFLPTDQYVHEFLTHWTLRRRYGCRCCKFTSNQERLNEKDFAPHSGPIFLQMACVEGMLFPDPALYVSRARSLSRSFWPVWSRIRYSDYPKFVCPMLTHFLETIKLWDTGFGNFWTGVVASAAYRAITKDDFDNLFQSFTQPASYFSAIRSFMSGLKHTCSSGLARIYY